jgi:hypothetical protein
MESSCNKLAESPERFFPQTFRQRRHSDNKTRSEAARQTGSQRLFGTKMLNVVITRKDQYRVLTELTTLHEEINVL